MGARSEGHKDRTPVKTTLQKAPDTSFGAPKSPKEWSNLCRSALKRAEACKDRRVEGLQRALATGTEQKVLFTLGIICEADVKREFG